MQCVSNFVTCRENLSRLAELRGDITTTGQYNYYLYIHTIKMAFSNVKALGNECFILLGGKNRLECTLL